MTGANGDAAAPEGAPARNQGADRASATHQTTVAAVIATIETATPAASTASARNTEAESSSRRAIATPATVQAARHETSNRAQRAKATSYATSLPLRSTAVNPCAQMTSPTDAGTAATVRPSATRGDLSSLKPPERRNRRRLGSVAATPAAINALPIAAATTSTENA